jgi:indoleamine 2,3-dioxygenase
MEYAGSYALYNYQLADPKLGLEYDNLRLIRAFEHGLDPKSSEAGFVLVHVAMVRSSGELVSGAMNALNGSISRGRKMLNNGLNAVANAMKKVNVTMNRKLRPLAFLSKLNTIRNVEQEQANRLYIL